MIQKLWFIATSLCFSCGVSALAAENDSITRCAASASKDARITCLEDVVRQFEETTRSEVEPAVPDVQQTAQPGMATSAPHEELSAVQSDESATNKAQFGLANSRPDTPSSIEVVVIAVDQNLYGKLVFKTESGQSWQQTDQRSPRFRDLPVQAIIRSAASGSFFLQSKDGGIATRVRRIR